MASTFEIADHDLIEDLAGLGKHELRGWVITLGDEAAKHVRATPTEVAQWASEVVLLTRVPPFAEASWHRGRVSDDYVLPHLSCKAIGDVITEVMARHPTVRLTVLCGHAHSGGEHNPLPNVQVITGAARYHYPRVQRTIEVA